ncbi:MAG: AbrB/MazE/SpoVT family DNA-binding domain-containing protein [Cyanobacteria bacterium P01_G01_bin.54]
MGNAIRTHLIKIGNSQGIRIPKPLLEQSGIKNEVEIEVQGTALIIRTISEPRQGWEQAFAAMAEQQDDTLLDNDITTEWEQTEWE